jgi:hypothetical protein
VENIEELLRRPANYNNIDGVAELAMGFMGVAFFLLVWMQWHSSPLSLWHSIWTLFAYVGLMCAIIHFGTKAIKERITYPRTGFISYRRSKAAWATIIAAPAAALTPLAIVALRKGTMDTSIPIFLAGSFFLTSGYAFRVAREVQWKWIVAGVMAGAAILVALLPAPALESVGGSSGPLYIPFVRLAGACLIYLLIWSVIILTSGGVSLWIYVHHTPLPKTEAE